MIDLYIQDALAYLRITHQGKLWIANLQSHVFDVEHQTTSQTTVNEV